jgi:putative oxidoreductase
VLLAFVGAGRLSVDHLVVIRRREAEAESEMSADADADHVIASWRDPSRPPAGTAGDAPPRDAPTSVYPSPGGGTAAPPGDVPVKGPVTFPEGSTGPAGPADHEATAPRKTRPRRTAKPAADDTTAESPAAPPPTGTHDRLVAGTRKSDGSAPD